MSTAGVKEEKRGLAYRILAVLCVIALAFAAIGASATAYADDSDTASITVTGATEGDTYYAYKLFDGTFTTDDDGNTVMGEAVVNSDYEEAIVNALADMGVTVEGYTYGSDGYYSGADSDYSDVARANNLMDAIEALQEDDTDYAGSTNRSFANTLADYLESVTATTSGTVSSDGTVVLSGLAEGYYLVTSATAGESGETTGMLIMLDGDQTSVTKTTTPVPEKEIVLDEETNAPVIFNDDGTATLTYTASGTVSSNILDFDTYYYCLKDSLPDGITITDSTSSISSWSITVDGTDCTNSFTMTTSNDGATVSWAIDDLLSIEGVDAETEVDLTYTITICASEVDALFGTDPVTTLVNEVSIVFSNDPSSEGEGDDDGGDTSETPPDGPETPLYSLTINKVDEDGEALSGAGFTVTLSDGSSAYEVTVSENDDGTFTFSGLAEDVTYTITETNTPDGYKSIDPIVFTIEADDDGNVAIVESSDASEAGTHAIDGNAITYTVVNVAGVDLPFTGEQGIALGVLVGAAVIIVSVAVIKRRHARGDA